MKLLFICTGNICRSPLAEGVMRHLVEQQGLGDIIKIDSAGTHSYHIGEKPDRRSIEVARAQGVDISNQRARQIQPSDFNDFDMILAMSKNHLRHCEAYDGSAKCELFLNYVPGKAGFEVPDPYYGEIKDFQHVYDLCYQASDALLDILKLRLSS